MTDYLKLYQAQLGLAPDGVLGKKTAASIMGDLGITDRLLFAHVMAQVAHESGMYTHFRENLSYSEAGLLNIFKKYYTPELAEAHAHKPEKIANHVYSKRNGNGDEASGDGWKYRGVFGLQLTGKTNIQEFLASIGLPIDTDPDSLKDNPRAYFQAAFFWFRKNGVDRLCTAANDNCILAVSKRVNGGTIGLEDRKAKSHEIFRALGIS